MNLTGKVKRTKRGAEAKASVKSALSLWDSDVKRDDLGMGRMKLG